MARGGEDLHAPGLQIQQTRTKNYIILSSGGGSRSTSRVCTNQNLLSTLLNYPFPALSTPGALSKSDRARLEAAIHTDAIGWTSAPISCRRPTRSAGRWQGGRGLVLPWEWGEILHPRAQMATWPPPWVQRCGRTGIKVNIKNQWNV